MKPKPRILNINAGLTTNGIRIKIQKKHYDIAYPSEVWRSVPPSVKNALLENLTYATTQVVPLALKQTGVKYNTNPPLLENLLYKNQVQDLINCATGDNKPHLSYLCQFYNLDTKYQLSGRSTIPDAREIKTVKNKKPVAIVPFTFGKESLTTVALCREVGIEPILVYCQEPSQPYEQAYKLEKLKEFSKEFGLKYYFLQNDTGLFRYGKAFGIARTELGWGTQTTVLAMMMVPFALKHGAKYILFGSEYANNEYEWNNGWKEWLSCDQTPDNTNNQNNIVRLLTGNQCGVRSSFQPLDEINIFYILHHRYPEFGRYQFSCSAEHPLPEGSQWCHKCYKCARMFLFASCCEVDPEKIGYQKNLLRSANMFDHYFGEKFATGSTHELDFSFYILHKKKYESLYSKIFAEHKLKQLHSWEDYVKHFTTIKDNETLPEEFREKLLSIYRAELTNFKKMLPK